MNRRLTRRRRGPSLPTDAAGTAEPPCSPAPRGRTVVLWTGGKDCTLALQELRARRCDVASLVTFVPAGGAPFRAHPVEVLAAQAATLGLPHRCVEIARPYRKGYEAAIRDLASEGCGQLVTGDIGPVGGCSNWVRDRAEAVGVSVRTPLWGRSREELLRAVVDRRWTAVFSYVRCPPLTPDWLERPLSAEASEELLRAGRHGGFDACGEQGEYHTLVLDGPLFRYPLTLDLGAPVRCGGAWHLEVRGVRRGGSIRPPRKGG
jgi:diphthine-ammonia ligase